MTMSALVLDTSGKQPATLSLSGVAVALVRWFIAVRLLTEIMYFNGIGMLLS